MPRGIYDRAKKRKSVKKRKTAKKKQRRNTFKPVPKGTYVLDIESLGLDNPFMKGTAPDPANSAKAEPELPPLTNEVMLATQLMDLMDKMNTTQQLHASVIQNIGRVIDRRG